MWAENPSVFWGGRALWEPGADMKEGMTMSSNVEVRDAIGTVLGEYASEELAKAAIESGDIADAVLFIATDGASEGYFYVVEGMSIAAAVAAASPGDTIQIGEGTFNETIDLSNTEGLIIKGAQAGVSAGAVGGVRDLDSTAGETIIVGGFTFGGGSPNTHGLTLDGLRLEGQAIGTVRITGDFVIENTIIDHNKASWGISTVGFSGAPDFTLTVSNSSIQGARGMEIGNNKAASVLVENSVFDTVSGAMLVSANAAEGAVSFIGNVVRGPGVSILKDGQTVVGNSFEAPEGSYGVRIFELDNGQFNDNTFSGDGVGFVLATGTGDNAGIGYENVALEGNTLTANAFANATGSAHQFGVNTVGGFEFETGIVVGADSSVSAAPIVGTPGNDMLVGTENDDVFIATAGNDSIDGLGGSDTYDLSNNTTGAFVDLESGFAFGGDATGSDTLVNIENVRGSSGFDVLNGNSQDNTFFASLGNDLIDGRGGNNTYDASHTANGVNINLLGGGANGAEIGNDTLSNIQNAVGGSGDDILVGNALDNVLSGGAGNDILVGGGGNNTLDGGEGLDAAVFSGDMGSFAIDANAGTVNGPDGNNTFSNIATLQFDDRSMHIVGEGGFATVQDALDVASQGDVIWVKPGVYEGRFEITVENITLLTDPADPATLSYSGADFFPVMEIFADGVTVANFNIVREDGDSGAQAIAVRTSDVSILDNTLTGIGGGFPGITVDHGLPGSYDLDVSNVLISGNTITGDFGWGVGIRSENGSGTLDGVSVVNNTIDVAGSGIFVFKVPASTGDISNLTVEDNELTVGGARHLFDNVGLVDIDDFVADNNLNGEVYFLAGSNDVFASFSAALDVGGANAAIWDAVAGHWVVADGMSIQAAIDAAEPGDTIIVGDGTYDAITVTKSLNILSENDQGAVINGAGVNQGSAVRIEAGIDGVQIGAAGQGFEINAGSGDLAAIYAVGNNDSLTVTGNAVDGGAAHAFMSGASGGQGLSNSTISDNSFTGSGPMALVYNNGQASLGAASEGNSFTGNTLEGGVSAGLLMGIEGDNATIEGNTFLGQASYAQLELWGAGASVEGNTFDAAGDQFIADPNRTYDGADLIEDNGSTTADAAVYIDGSGNVFSSIQAAINAALPGDSIIIPSGDYAENLVIDKPITLQGEDGAVLSSVSGVSITITDAAGGDVTIDNLDLVGDGANTGIAVLPGADVGTLSFTNGVMENFPLRGIFSTNNGDEVANPTLQAIVVSNAEFSSNGEGAGPNKEHIKLFGFEGDASFTNVVINGADPSAASADRPGNAIEIIGGLSSPGNANGSPLPAPDMGNIVFDGVEITGAFSKNPVGIFNFGDIDGLSFAGAGLDLSAAESGWKLFNLDGITGDINANGFIISYPAGSGIVAELQGSKPGQGPSDQTIIGSDANELLVGKSGVNLLDGGAGDDILVGGSGSDTLIGRQGNNQLFGGDGDDLIFAGLNDLIDGGDGTDVVVFADGTLPSEIEAIAGNITNVEVIRIGDDDSQPVTFVVLDGMSIQTAINYAKDGDTIVVSEGTFEEDLWVNRSITIEGANAGLAGHDDARSSETVLNGEVDIVNGFAVAFDGFQFLNDDPARSDTVYVRSGADATIANSVFLSTVAGGNTGGLHDVAIFTEVLGSGSLTVTDNLFAGDGVGGKYSTAAWGRAIWLNDSDQADVEITGNEIRDARTGINLENYDNATTVVDGNTFHTGGTGIAFGGPVSGDITNVTNNVFVDVDTDFNAQNLAGDISFDLGATGNTAEPGGADADGVLLFRAGAGNDNITAADSNTIILGGNGDDTLVAGSGDDILAGGEGDDTLIGREGANVLDGGAGNDIILAGLNDTIDGGDGFDTVIFAEGTDPADILAMAGSIENVEIIRIGDDTAGGNTFVVLEGMSIQDAINAAQANDTIVVGSGDFSTGTLNITKSLTILGANAGEAGNDGSGGKAVRSADETVVENSQWIVSAADVQISGFTFEITDGTGKSPIQVGNVEGTEISGNIIQGGGANGGRGVELVGGFSGSVTITENFIDSFSTGVFVNPVNGGSVTIANNVLSNHSAGVGSSGMANTEIENNYFVDNTSEAIGADNLGSGVVINGNSFEGPGAAGFIKLDYAGFTNFAATDGNWFGTTDATVIAGLLSENVSVTSYLDSGNDGDLAAPGFQGDGDLVGTTVQNTTQGLGYFTLAAALAAAAPGDAIAVGEGDYSGEGVLDVNVDNLTINAVANAVGIDLQAGAIAQLTLAGAAQMVVRDGPGGNTLIGNNGNTTVIANGGDDTYNGGGGTNTLDLSGNAAGATVNLNTGVAAGGTIGVNLISNFTNVRGGDGNDTLIGNASNNTFFASAGNDTINGNGGTNTYDASGSGSAVAVDLGLGNAGGTAIGSDTLSNIQNVTGSAFNDILIGSNANNIIRGTAGNNTIQGVAGNNQLFGGEGNDTIHGGSGNDFIRGIAGDNTIHAGGGVNNILGGSGNDTIYGGDNGDILGGGAGDDTIYGGAGNDEIRGGQGNDTLYGGGGDDLIFGGTGMNFVDGGTGFDTAGFGGSVNDYVIDYGAGTVTSLIHGGVTTLANIEMLRFDDAEFRFVNPDAEPRFDLNGDGAGDFVFRLADDSWAVRGLDGQTRSVNAQSNWQLLAVADFNGDGVADMLFERPDGLFVMVDGETDVRNGLGNSANQFVGIGDFNGNGSMDLLLTTTTGAYVAVAGDGTGFIKGFGASHLSLKAVADFDGDGVSDLLFVNANGQHITINGLTNAQTNLGNAPNTFISTADFTGNGNADMLMMNAMGNYVLVATDGTGFIKGLGFNGATVAAVGDFDGDGITDVLFKTGDEEFVFVDANGAHTNLGQINGTLAGVNDVNGDGIDDLLFKKDDGSYFVFRTDTQDAEYDIEDTDLTLYSDDLLNRDTDMFII